MSIGNVGLGRTTGQIVALVSALACLRSERAHGQDGAWSLNANGTWSTPGNWSGSVIADGADNTATFPDIINAARVVTLDTSRDIGFLSFADASHNYTLAASGGSELTLSVGAGSPTIAVTVAARSATISAPLAGDDGMTAAGPGTLILSGPNTYSGGTIISGGILSINADARLGDAAGDVTFSGSSQLSLTGADSYGAGRLLTIDPGVTATLSATAVASWDGKLTGAGALTKIGASVLVLTGTNDFSGDVLVSAGVLRAVDGIGLPAGGSAGYLRLAGGVWESSAAIARTLGTGAGELDVGTGASGFGASGGNITITLNGGAALTWNSGNFAPTTSFTLNATTSDGNILFVNDIDLNNATRTVAVNTGVAEMSGELSSVSTTLGLTKTGVGVLYLSGANTYTGATTINGTGGALRARDGVGLNSASRIVMSAGIWESDTDIARTLGTGSGQLSLAAASGFGATGTDIVVTLNGGAALTWTAGSFAPTTLVFNHSSATNDVTFVNDISFTTAARTVQVTTNTATLSGALSSSSAAGGLTKTGVGTLILSGAGSTYTGPTLVNAGTLLIDDEARLGANPASFTAAQLNLTGTLKTTASFAFDDSNRGLTLSGTTATFEVDPGTTLTIDSAVAGAGRLIKRGAGTLVLNNAGNTYGPTTAGTRLNEGTLVISDDGQLGTATGDFYFEDDSTLHSTATLTMNSGRALAITAGKTATLIVDDGTELTLAGAIATGTGALVKEGLGTLTFTAASLHDGGTAINAGTVKYGINNGLAGPAIGDNVSLAAGAVLDLAGFSGTIDRLTGLGTVTNSSSSASVLTLGIANSDADINFDGWITDGGAPGTLGITKGLTTGSRLFLTNPTNDYSGDTTVAQGTLALGAAGVIPNGAGKGNVALSSTGDTLDLNGFDETINGLNLAGVVTNSAGAATLTFGDGDANGNFTGVIRDGDGTLAVTKIGSGLQIFGTASSHAYSGDLTINAGAVAISAANVLGDGAGRGSVVIGVSGTLDINGNAETINGLSGSGIVTNAFTSGTDILAVGANDATSTFDGAIGDGPAILQLTKTGTGTLTLTGANTFSGVTLLTAGTLHIAHGAALGDAGARTLLTSGATLEIEGGITVPELINVQGFGVGGNGALRSVSGNNTITGTITNGLANTRINCDGGTLIVAPAGGDAIFSATLGLFLGGAGDMTLDGPIGGTTAQLFKDGSGTLRLNGTTTTLTTGQFAISNGTVLVNGSLSGTTAGILVGDGAILGGYGSTTRAITNQSGSVMAPGDPLATGGIGTLTTRQWELQAGSSNVFEITDETIRDQVIVQNNNGLKIDGGAFYLFQPGTTTPVSADGNYDLIQYSGTIQGAGVSALSVANPQPGKTYDIVESGGWVRMKISSAKAWDGGAADNYWSSGDNWSDDAAPNPNQELQFETANRLNNTNDTGAGVLYAGITFNSGAGPFVLDGDAINLTAAIANHDDDVQTINLDLALDGNDRDLNTSAGDLVLNGDISQAGGTYGLTKSGNATAVLAGDNSFGGTVLVNAGALRAASASALGDTAAGTTVADGAALEVAGNVTIATESLALTGAGVSSGGALRNVSGDNTYGGVITMGANSRINADSGSSLILDVGSASAILGTGLEVNFGGDGDITVVDGVDTGVGGSVVKDGAGTVTLMDNNDYRGLTAINAGALRIGNNAGLGTTAGATEVAAGAALEFTNTLSGVAEVITLNGSGVANGGALRNVGDNNTITATITLGPGGARINSDSGTLTFRGVVTASGADLTLGGAGDTLNTSTGISGAGRLIKDGSGTFNMNVASTYTGETIITNGTFRLGVAGIPNGAAAADVYVYAGATLDVNLADTINGLWGNGLVDNSVATARLLTVGDNDASSTFSGTLANSGAAASLQLTKIGTGTLTLLGTNTWGGVTIISGGTLTIGDGNTYGTLGTADVTANTPGQVIFNRSDDIAHGDATTELKGTGNFSQNGTGTLTLNGVNTFTGTLFINSGAVRNGAAERQANTSSLEVNGGGTFDINNANETIAAITLNDGNLTSTGAGGFLYGNSITAASGLISAKLGDRTATTFTKNGAGTVTLTRTGNGYTGKTTINAGTLAVARLANVGVASSLGAPLTVPNGTIELGSDTNEAVLRFAGDAGDGDSTSDRVINLAGTTGPVTIEAAAMGVLALTADFTATGAGAKTLVLAGSNTLDNTISGAIVNGSGTTSLTKRDSGTWILDGTNTYTGATTLDGGTLVVNGVLDAGSTVSIDSGAVLMGTGTIGGAVANHAGATLAPGASVGSLTVGSLDLEPGSTNAFEFNDAANDHVIVTDAGGLNLPGGGVLLYAEGGTTTWATNGIYNLIQYNGGLSGDVENLAVLNPVGGKTYVFSADGTWVKLAISDGLPLLSVADAGTLEGDSGQTALNFTITLHETSAALVSGTFSTADGTAKDALGDYAATLDAFSIPIGALSTQVTVLVNGDTDLESDEAFTLIVSGVTNASIVDGSALGTITNDDSFAGVWYVDDSATGGNDNGFNWGDAFTNLQDALSAAGGGDAIWVAAGTYKPGVASTSKFVLPSGVALYGGFAGTEGSVAARLDPTANPSVLSGDLDGSDSPTSGDCTKLLECAAGGGQTVDGFTVQHTYYNGFSGAGDLGGGGVRILGPNTTIRGCIIRAHFADYGAALGIQSGAGGGQLIENCIFSENDGPSPSSVAGYYRGGATTFRHCTFYGNSNSAADGTWQARSGGPYALENVITWDSSGAWPGGFKRNDVSLPTVDAYNCDVGNTGWIEGTQGTSHGVMVNANPVFVDGTTPPYNLRLQAVSPCIDTGDNGVAAAADIRGATRPIGATVDIGAYEMSAFYETIVLSAPASGLSVTVGGSTKTTPNAFTNDGTVAMSTVSPQTVGATRYTFQYWTNAPGAYGSADNPHVFTLDADTNWTAVFSSEYRATGTPSPLTGAGTVTTNPVDGWVSENGSVTFTATPDIGWSFDHWEDDTGTDLGTTSPLTLTPVTAPTNVTAYFTAAGGEPVTVQTSPSGLTFHADGDTWTAPHTYSWPDASVHVLWVAETQQVTAVQQARFLAWDDGTTGVVTTNWSYVVPSGGATVTATFDILYALSTTVSGAGHITTNPTVSDAYYIEGEVAQLTAVPDPGYAFDGWSGDAAGSVNPTNITMNAGKSVTATFVRTYFVKPAATGAANGDSWADACTLAYATANASGGDRVFVQGGDYTVASNGEFDIAATGSNTGPALEIYGGFDGTEASLAERPADITAIATRINVNGMARAMQIGNINFLLDGLTFTNQSGAFAAGVGAVCTLYTGVNHSSEDGTVRRCTFADNQTALNFFNTNYRENNTIENCVFDSNTGKTIHLGRMGGFTIRNCTLYNNIAPGISSGGSGTFGVIENCILNDNGGASSTAAATTIDSCVVRVGGDTSGNAQTTDTPGFADAANGDFRLVGSSLALDNANATFPSTDVRGAARPDGAAADIGAYEGIVYLLTVNIAGAGAVDPNTGWYDAGEVAALTATADVGNVFSAWSGDASGTLPTVNVSMTADRNVTATFVPVAAGTTIFMFR